LKLEAGAESRAPMAVVVIGGVISSTMLTLVLVPVVYTLLDDAKVFFARMVSALRRKEAVGEGMPAARLAADPASETMPSPATKPIGESLSADS
ncbi:MAG: efflux RND transporter permease subunit, partial [Chloroflexota bacterium]